MSATETIISFAVKKVLDKAVGGPMPIVTGYHKTHFILLARAIQESNRDSDIQNLDLARDLSKRTAAELAKVEKNLDMKGAKWDAMRKISNARRFEDIQFIKIDEMDKLSNQIGDAQRLLNAYDDI